MFDLADEFAPFARDRRHSSPGRRNGRAACPHRREYPLLRFKYTRFVYFESAMKTALVTGASSGIGRAIADRLRADGNHVASIDLTESDTDFSYVADVTDRGQIDAALNAARSALGPITILINAAGMTVVPPVHESSPRRNGRRSSTSTCNGVFHVTQAVLPDMLEAGWGRIVNISSSSTHSGSPYQTALRGSQVRGQRSDEKPCAGIRSARHHRQRGAARIRSTPQCCVMRRKKGLLGGSIEDIAAQHSCTTDRVARGHRRRRARSWCPRRPATSPGRSSA